MSSAAACRAALLEPRPRRRQVTTLHHVPVELEDQLNASLSGLYSLYQTRHKGNAVYRLRSTKAPYPSTYSTAALALSMEAVQNCLNKEQDKLAAAGISESTQRQEVLAATLQLTEEWLQQQAAATAAAVMEAAEPAGHSALLPAPVAEQQVTGNAAVGRQQQLQQQAADATSNLHLEQLVAQLLPLLQGLAICTAAAAAAVPWQQWKQPDDGKEAATHESGRSSSSTASTDLLAGSNCNTTVPFVAAAAVPCTPPRQASSGGTSSTQEATPRALVGDLAAAAAAAAAPMSPLQLPQDSSTQALLARGWAYIKAHVPDVPYFIPDGSCSSAVDPSLGLPEVFIARGTRLFVCFTAKHGGKGAFMVAKRSTGITAEVRVLRCADGSPASARQHLLGLLLELADHGWAWEAARPRGGRQRHVAGGAGAYGAGNALLLQRVQQLVQQLEA